MLLSSYREKDSVQRVAVIWNETEAAIQSFLESDENHHDSEFLFADANGKPMNKRFAERNRLFVRAFAIPFKLSPRRRFFRDDYLTSTSLPTSPPELGASSLITISPPA